MNQPDKYGKDGAFSSLTSQIPWFEACDPMESNLEQKTMVMKVIWEKFSCKWSFKIYLSLRLHSINVNQQ